MLGLRSLCIGLRLLVLAVFNTFVYFYFLYFFLCASIGVGVTILIIILVMIIILQFYFDQRSVNSLSTVTGLQY